MVAQRAYQIRLSVARLIESRVRVQWCEQFYTVFSNTVASGASIGRTSRTTTFNNETWTSMPPSERKRVIWTTRYLEQYIDESVTLDTQQTNNEDMAMDKDRIKGSAEQAKGAVKETVGKVFGDKKLETEGKTDKAAGKVQNAIGGLKDAVRGK
jgi:uncharacterized protein YjbJ (UPF0337 family)